MPHIKKNDNSLNRLLPQLWDKVYSTVAELNVSAWLTREPVPFSKRTSGKRIVIAPGVTWGELFDCAWFNFQGTVPSSARGQQVFLQIHTAGEALIVDRKGNPVQGLTGYDTEIKSGFGSSSKQEVPVCENAKGGEKIDLWADVGCNNLFGRYEKEGQFQYARIVVRNPIFFDLYYDFACLKDLLTLLPETSARYARIKRALHNANDVLLRFTDEEARRAREILAPELQKKNGDTSFEISAVGHAHLDLAWLWPERETYRKGARTFATALANMDKYPDYVFGASQPQLYSWIKELYPDLYKRVKQRIAEKRWECQGCMWVESDTNIAGGEALVRQVLYGKRFYQEEFGIEINHLWLPDVFGYTASLPQILVKSGCDYFLTQKLSWSKVNVYPHHTFFWKGIDGSKVLTHFPPEDTYNSNAAPSSAKKTEMLYKDKDISSNAFMLFGIGDGGGGPGEQHLESLKRIKNLEGIPPVKQMFAADFFADLSKNAASCATWDGELYLEYHQGTLTTQARNKWHNRKMEFALRDAELWASLASKTSNLKYPQKELNTIWGRILFLQFHDILPGSSIDRVYVESLEEYAKHLKRTKEIAASYDTAIASRIDTTSVHNPAIVFNSLSWNRHEWLHVGDTWKKASVPSMGYAVIERGASDEIPSSSATNTLLENELLRVTFGKDGSIIGVYDKCAKREVLEKGARANVLNVYKDVGDAWDFNMDYAVRLIGEFVMTSSFARVDGPQAILEQKRSFEQSTLTQKIVLTAGSRRIDFITEVSWNCKDRMLRVDFPVAILARDVTCDIQFGSLQRPTHRNTSWDMAKQEICAHKWVDLSEPLYGVALMNDSKYGHEVKRNVLNLNLLRSTGHPGKQGDRDALHQFTYALYPHSGNHLAGEVARAGYELNVPLQVVAAKRTKGTLPQSLSFFDISVSNVIIETVKKTEDDDGMIVRMYENSGSATRAKLSLGFEGGSAEMVDLMERSIRKLAVKKGVIDLSFGPFEILTVKLQ